MRKFKLGMVSASLLVVGLAGIGTMATPTTGHAACKATLSFKGPLRPTPAIADFNAIERWQWDAEKKYSRRYADWRRARNAKTDCKFVGIGFICTATARPCNR